MKSLKIDFETSGATIYLDEIVEGTLNTAQKCLVNLGTIQGSCPIYPTKGTDILLQAVRGELISTGAAQHAANFAALNTVVFTRLRDPQDNLDDLTRVTAMSLVVTGLENQNLQLEASMTFADNSTLGLEPDLAFS